eukprot:scaffold60723_cov38-Cyclotella_meneghiniana.AAC.4
MKGICGEGGGGRATAIDPYLRAANEAPVFGWMFAVDDVVLFCAKSEEFWGLATPPSLGSNRGIRGLTDWVQQGKTEWDNKGTPHLLSLR